MLSIDLVGGSKKILDQPAEILAGLEAFFTDQPAEILAGLEAFFTLNGRLQMEKLTAHLGSSQPT